MKHTLLSILFLTLPCLANDGPCAKDRETFCGNIAPGGGAILKCMKENEAKLSPECKAFRTEVKGEIKEVKAACKDDAQKVCGGLKYPALRKCMHENHDKLSEPCQAEIHDLKAMKKRK